MKSVYAVSREYGGPEEGGWWYNHFQYLRPYEGEELYNEDAELHRVDYVERVLEESVVGENETMERPYYD